ncbi:MAG: NusG domain II-containing protein [Chitinispirillales bacterium]|jgi:hypothetical protein|nr:NusG domain II-containing protein [Chitinispirillales bacterium]
MAGEFDFSGAASDVPEAIRPYGIVDAVVILIMICGIFFTASSLKSGRPDHIAVFRQNSIIAKYPLNDDIAFTVNGKIGTLDIEIRDGAVKILHANCPRKICQLSGGISGSRGQLICAPNNILIQIRSSKTDNDIDAIAY